MSYRPFGKNATRPYKRTDSTDGLYNLQFTTEANWMISAPAPSIYLDIYIPACPEPENQTD